MLSLASVTPLSLARVKALQGAGVLAHELGEEGVLAARRAGQALTLQAAVEEALAWLSLDLEARSAAASPTPEPASPDPADSSATGSIGEQLTRREREIAALIGQGLTSPEIAERLVISRGTVDAHADHIRAKLDLRSRAEIEAWAVRRGVVRSQRSSQESGVRRRTEQANY